MACLNIFISLNLNGTNVVVSTGTIFPLVENKQPTVQIIADTMVIEGGHLNGSLYLPDALRPKKLDIINPHINNITAGEENPPKCCLIASATYKHPPKDIRCFGTCFLPRACTDVSYPFQSTHEKSFFLQQRSVSFSNRRVSGAVMIGSESQELQRKCTEMNARLHPPYQWCQQWLLKNDDNQNITYDINPYEANLPPAGCSLVPKTRSAYQHLLLFPRSSSTQFKATNNTLAFCGIPKNGITNWIQLLRFIIGAPDYQSIPHYKSDWTKFKFDSLGEDVQLNILNDESYTFAVFLRDPAERLLSFYLDKVNGDDEKWKSHFVSIHGLNKTPSFGEFVKMIDGKRTSCPFTGRNSERISGVDWCTNPHWAPQTFNCGLSEFLPRFKFIGTLDRIERQSKQILEHVGLWEPFGRFYHIERNRQTDCAVPSPELKVGDVLSGFQQQQQRQKKLSVIKSQNDTTTKFSHHSTQSKTKLDQYYTEELLSIVKRLYARDYELWDLIKDEEDLVSGSELAMRLSSKCLGEAVNVYQAS